MRSRVKKWIINDIMIIIIITIIIIIITRSNTGNLMKPPPLLFEGASVDCGIVTSSKLLLWGNFDLLSLESF